MGTQRMSRRRHLGTRTFTRDHDLRWRRPAIWIAVLLVAFTVMPVHAAGAQEAPTADAPSTADAEVGTETTTTVEEAENPTSTTVPADDTDATGGEDSTTAVGDEASTVEDSSPTVEDQSPTTADGSTPTVDGEQSPELPQAESEPSETADQIESLAAESDATVLAAESDVSVLAAGPPVYEIEGDWVNPPPTISRGEPVVAEWRVNVNDSGEPPSNDPVDNVTVDFNLTNAFFDELPDLCLTEGVDPPSSISDDGRVLTCNLGTVNMGTAVVVQTPVVADGVTGDFVTHDGTIEGQTVDLDPIEIVNPFVLDIFYGPNSNNRGNWNEDFSEVQIDIQWSLRLGLGSDPGPENVSYVLNVTEVDGANVDVGNHPISGLNCSPFDRNSSDGHPWSGLDSPPNQHRITSFVDGCTLTERPTQPGVFDLTLTGINYDLMNVPTHDAARGGGNPLPTNFNYIASGSLWFSVDTTTNGSIQVASNAPEYEAPTGQLFTDPIVNNTTNKSYTLPGSWSAAWERAYTQSGGTPWDDSYRVSPGTSVRQVVTNRFSGDSAAPGALYGNCLVFDTAFVTLASFDNSPDGVSVWAGNSNNPPPVSGIVEPPGPLQYYVGPAPADPDQFNCGADAANWTTTPPSLEAVQAVRMIYPFSSFAAYDAEWFQIRAVTTINPDVEIGDDVWMFGSALAGTRQGGAWFGPENQNVVTETPDARYDFTNGRRDIVRIIGADPFIQKAAAQATVTPGVPADFTLTYSATGAGIIPDFVDDYEIVDTLPPGMFYEPGSADIEPVVTMSGDQQVLTWTIDGVATNVEHELTYQAFADPSVPPGTTLTNTAVSHLNGLSANPVEATVTTTTNGYTTILKTSDVDYIPNDAGDGVGTGSWTVTIESFDPLPQAFTDTIDILPYNGDNRGTSFSGTYSLDDVVVPAGATVYYTEDDPTTLSDDPSDPSNGTAPGDVTGNSVGWTTDAPAAPTAIRVIGPELPPGGEFSFQVVITTDGAEPQNVYVNRAQAIAEHTELVMRTSAALVVTDYEVVKVSDPESGSNVNPGDVINYTITVTQVGDVPAGALLTDDLSQVFDDAIYNNDVTTDLGTVSIDGDVLDWEGVIPVGGVVTITYSVTMKDAEAIEEEGDAFLVNVVSSPGCRLPEHCTTNHSAGRYEYDKFSDPAAGEEVQVGDVITYRLEIGATFGRIEDAIVVDDLSDALDDATWNDDLDVPVGDATLEGTTLTWTGDLDVDEVVVLTYSVTVTGDGDGELNNVVTSPDIERAVCARQNPGCATDHTLAPAVAPAGPPAEPGSPLPRTGGSPWVLVAVAVLLVSAGVFLTGRAGGWQQGNGRGLGNGGPFPRWTLDSWRVRSSTVVGGTIGGGTWKIGRWTVGHRRGGRLRIGPQKDGGLGVGRRRPAGWTDGSRPMRT